MPRHSPFQFATGLCWLWLLGGVMAGAAEGPGFREVARPFIEQHCLACHGEKSAKAGFRMDLLSADFAGPTVAEQWQEVIDRVNAGEMPPKDKPRPDARQAAAFVGWVNGQLRAVELAAKQAGGRIPMRRLNRDEYANTVRDLLQLDANLIAPLVEELPADGTAEGFDRLGAALYFDQTQVERSLAVAGKVAARAIQTEPPKVNRVVRLFNATAQRPLPERLAVHAGFTNTIPRGAVLQWVRPDHVEYLQGGGSAADWGKLCDVTMSKVVTEDGYYRFRIRATVDNRARTESNRLRLQFAKDSPIQAQTEVVLDGSGLTEVVMFLRGPVNGEVKGPQTCTVLWNHVGKAVLLEPGLQKLESQWKAVMTKMERSAVERVPETELAALRRERDEIGRQFNAWRGPRFIYDPAVDIEKLPRLRLEAIEVEGPVQPEGPPASQRALFFAGDERTDAAYVREVFARFLPRAYRRPVTAAELDAVVKVVAEAQGAGGAGFRHALRQGLQWVLSSPGFLFLGEPAGAHAQPRRLTDFELATRLSYFLWSTMPDEELFAQARAGRLREPAVVAAQLRRMVADPRASQFVRNFGGQWLSVRDYGSVQPAAEYRDYDKALEQAGKQEPLAFFAEVLARDLPITAFLDSDFLVVNERLAKHYGIPGVTGPEFRRVAIQPAHHRGGVLGMAGLMTFLADGTRTLPMRRGAWVLRELFHDPPNNPPPNAGEIQPNTGGKSLTVRERLELHRRDEICASCHAKLDPFGLALENYDAIGQWRERFNGEGIRGPKAPLLNVSGQFPDGRKFTTLEEYKAGLLAQKDKFARAFSTKLLTYALGRPVGYPDHAVLDGLTAALKQNDYRLQPLLHAIVASEPFNTK